MTIIQAIDWLRTLERQHGNVQVYFDCPTCGNSFKPATIVAQAVHITATETEPPKS